MDVGNRTRVNNPSRNRTIVVHFMEFIVGNRRRKRVTARTIAKRRDGQGIRHDLTSVRNEKDAFVMWKMHE